MKLRLGFVAVSALLAVTGAAQAQIKVGVTVSATGPAATLGIPEKNAVSLMPKTIGGKSVDYIILDDASDPTTARRNAERFVGEDKVDLIIGSSTSPASLAMIEVVGRGKTPAISLGAARSIIHPMDDNRKWVFKTPYNDATVAGATVKHMKETGIKTVGIIAFNDAYGEGWVAEFTPIAKEAGINIVAVEKFARNDTSVTAQALKVLTAKPDAVVIIASGTPGVLPQSTLVERGYKGKFYQTTGIVNNDFLRVGAKAVEGTLVAGAPLVVADELPPGHPARDAAIAFKKAYEGSFGAGSVSAFGGYAWDAALIAQFALGEAAKKAQPGTEQFRAAVRDAIEAAKGVSTTAGPVTMSASDHNGYSADAPVIITVREGAWKLQKP